MELKKRTFEALNYPKGSKEREALNFNSLTSEYITSYKYLLFWEALYLGNWVKHETSFRTKKEALGYFELQKVKFDEFTKEVR